MKQSQGKFFEIYFSVFESTWPKVLKIISIFSIAAALDILSIGLIAPFLAIATNASSIEQSSMLARIFYQLTGLDVTSNPQIFVQYLGVLLIAIFVCKGFVAYKLQYTIARIAFKEALALRLKLMKAYMGLPYEYFLSKNSSEVVQSMILNTNNFINGVLLTSFRVGAELLTLFFIVLLLSYKAPLAVAVMVGALGVFVLFYNAIIRKRSYRYGRSTNSASMGIIQDVTQFVRGFKDIKILGVGTFFYRRIEKNAEIMADDGAKQGALLISPKYVIETIIFTVVVTAIILVVSTGKNLQEYYPILGMFALAAVRLIPSTSTIMNGMAQMKNHIPSMEIIHDVLQRHRRWISKGTTTDDQVEFDHFRTLKLENVSFRYEDKSKFAIKNVSFELVRGKSLGLIGKSGSGKTTLVDVILDLLHPEDGKISVNETPIKKCLNFWRKQVAYIPQMIFLMDDSLKRNIALGESDAEIDEKRLYAAIQDAALSDVIATLPQGLDTQVGESGIKLSGGQRQRVALARAFYFQKEVIIMDEATSSLDYETEKTIIDTIKQLQGKKTMIVIAHRLSTIQDCDSLIELSEGAVVNTGKPEDVLRV